MDTKVKRDIHVIWAIIVLVLGAGFITLHEAVNSGYEVHQVVELPSGKPGFIHDGKEYRVKCNKRRMREYQVYLWDKETKRIGYKITSIDGLRDLTFILCCIYAIAVIITMGVYTSYVDFWEDADEKEWELTKEYLSTIVAATLICVVIQILLFFV